MRARQTDLADPRDSARWPVAGLIVLCGCLGEFMSEAQVAARVEAFQLSADVAAAATDASGLADVGDASAARTDVGAEAIIAVADGVLDADQGPDIADVVEASGVDADGDAACLATSATLDHCNGADDDCDGQTDEDACDDGNACTTADACVAAVCAGKPTNCDDKDPCTLDGCAPSGPSAGICTHAAADGIPCDDGDPCSIGDNCKAGGCSGVAKNCFNSNFCYKAFCAPGDGKCTSTKKAVGTGCDDGNACTSADVCDSDAVCSG